MKSSAKFIVVLISVISLRYATAAEEPESAPQEPPYTQEENEFENFETAPVEEQPQAVEETSAEQTPEAVTETTTTPEKLKKGVKYIEHPLAEKGLVRINKDGSYVYKTEETTAKNISGALRYGAMDPPDIKAADGTTYDTMYGGASQSLISFDYEWHPFSGYGKLGLQTGFGFLIAYGSGRFLAPGDPLNGQIAKEEYTFVAIPLNLGVVYRLEWLTQQWLAPYVAAGGTYVAVAEIRDDGKNPTYVGTPGAYGAGGVLFNISAINKKTAFTLRSEYGIQNLWLSLDYRYLQTFNDEINFSSSIIGGGIVVDY